MTYTYKLLGMTCVSCEAKVTKALSKINGIDKVTVSKVENTAIINMSKAIPIDELQSALDNKYTILAYDSTKKKSWVITYKPILIIFFYISLSSILSQIKNDVFNFQEVMRYFMAGFFLVFSFFKMLNLKGFVNSYAMYDIIAKKIPSWGYVYAFIELALGISFLINYQPILTNTITIIVMSVSIIGVLQSVLNKKQIQCACLGTVFNLPMSTVTIIEDALMIIMSALMLIQLL